MTSSLKGLADTRHSLSYYLPKNEEHSSSNNSSNPSQKNTIKAEMIDGIDFRAVFRDHLDDLDLGTHSSLSELLKSKLNQGFFYTIAVVEDISLTGEARPWEEKRSFHLFDAKFLEEYLARGNFVNPNTKNTLSKIFYFTVHKTDFVFRLLLTKHMEKHNQDKFQQQQSFLTSYLDANNGELTEQHKIAVIYEKAGDKEKAAIYYLLMSFQGSLIGSAWMASYYRDKNEFPKAINYYVKSAYSCVAKNDIVMAIDYFKTASNYGDAASASWLGKHYENKNTEEALKYFKIASNYGDVASARWLGMYYENNEEIEEALKYFKIASDLGCGATDLWFIDYYDYYYQEHKDEYDEEVVRKYQLRAAERGDVRSQSALGNYYFREWFTKDWCQVSKKLCVKYHKMAADGESSEGFESAVKMSLFYRDGFEVEKSDGESEKYQKIAEKFFFEKDVDPYFGNMLTRALAKAEKEGNLGKRKELLTPLFDTDSFGNPKLFETFYLMGRDLLAEAENLTGDDRRLTMEHGERCLQSAGSHPKALHAYGCLLLNKNSNESLQYALRHFLSAAKEGHCYALFQVHFFYLKGIGGVAKDTVEALKWLNRAIQHGVADAIYQLSLYYSEGIFIEKRTDKAQKWDARLYDIRNKKLTSLGEELSLEKQNALIERYRNQNYHEHSAETTSRKIKKLKQKAEKFQPYSSSTPF